MVILTLPAGGSKGAGAPVEEGRMLETLLVLAWCWLVTHTACCSAAPARPIHNKHGTIPGHQDIYCKQGD